MKRKILPLLLVLSSLILAGCRRSLVTSESSLEESSSEVISSESSSKEVSSEESSSETSSSSEDNHYTGYYSSITYDMEGATLLANLQTLMFSTHSYYPSYGEIRYEFDDSDKDPNNENNIICFYSHQSMPSAWDPNVYNREHVWPQSKSAGLYPSTNNSYSGPGSDLHHVRPAKVSENSERGNSRFGDFVPNNNVKGDCARIVMYMYMHYCSNVAGTGNKRSQYTAALKLSDVFTNYSLLKSWNELDPVDELEIARNEYCYKYQGNRNPFIDHPEWIDKISL